MRDLANQVLKQAFSTALKLAAAALTAIAYEQRKQPRMRSLGRKVTPQRTQFRRK